MLNVNETVTSIKPCYKIRYLSLKIWRYAESPYLCNVKVNKRLAVWDR